MVTEVPILLFLFKAFCGTDYLLLYFLLTKDGINIALEYL